MLAPIYTQLKMPCLFWKVICTFISSNSIQTFCLRALAAIEVNASIYNLLFQFIELLVKKLDLFLLSPVLFCADLSCLFISQSRSLYYAKFISSCYLLDYIIRLFLIYFRRCVYLRFFLLVISCPLLLVNVFLHII